jgi:hypothetical protein
VSSNGLRITTADDGQEEQGGCARPHLGASWSDSTVEARSPSGSLSSCLTTRGADEARREAMRRTATGQDKTGAQDLTRRLLACSTLGRHLSRPT